MFKWLLAFSNFGLKEVTISNVFFIVWGFEQKTCITEEPFKDILICGKSEIGKCEMFLEDLKR